MDALELATLRYLIMIFTFCAKAEKHNRHFHLFGFFSYCGFLWGFQFDCARLGWPGQRLFPTVIDKIFDARFITF